jgi:predicted RecB family nuclease
LNRIITSEVLVSYSQCPRKAYFLLCTSEKGTPNEYINILQHRKSVLQNRHINEIQKKNNSIQPYSISNQKKGIDFLVNATLISNQLEAYCPILRKEKDKSRLGHYLYIPTIFVGTYNISKEHKLELFFISYILGQVQNKLPDVGYIIKMDEKLCKVNLKNIEKTLFPYIDPLRSWAELKYLKEPDLILNKHCQYCKFNMLCKEKAEKEDSLSLLSRISTKKIVQKYEKKGIFTIKQLSYLYRPRRRKKSTKKRPIIHRPELQALAINTDKIYLEELPELSRKTKEIFLDFEGIPDQQYYYLIGMLICNGNIVTYYYFWADNPQEESNIWKKFLQMINRYPSVYIYHYGSYESKAIDKLCRRYKTDSNEIKIRLVNVNTQIYGKVYFPLRSNSLKEIGKFIGASWTSPNASGLQSLVWHHYWSESGNQNDKQRLITYNKEDCYALKLLVDELYKIQNQADLLSNIDFVDQPKTQMTETSSQIHKQFNIILKFAHENFDKRKISLKQNEIYKTEEKKKIGAKEGHQAYYRLIPKAKKVIHVRSKQKCPKHKDQILRKTQYISERTIIDLVFTSTGIRKSIIKYWGTKSYCSKCNRLYLPNTITKLGNCLFGHSFRAWIIYQRLFLRLPYDVIIQVLIDQFNEKISVGTIINFFRCFSNYYSFTEKLIIRNVLKSPFIHIDETKINIQGIDHYVWVFTDGKHVFFRYTETREAKIVHDILTEYAGILISDFYGGYDSVKCKQQKCWSHLIDDINDDLLKAPFDIEYEKFVLEIRNLILPIFQAVEKYGLKKRNLNKFKKNVDHFYKNTIFDKYYKSDLTVKYQKRFIRYKESLFTFLEYDGTPWNNNLAERALRHLAVQRKISRLFYKSVVEPYLLLLGIMQTCRFQNKAFLQFLVSGMKDFNKSKNSKIIKNSILSIKD